MVEKCLDFSRSKTYSVIPFLGFQEFFDAHDI